MRGPTGPCLGLEEEGRRQEAAQGRQGWSQSWSLSGGYSDKEAGRLFLIIPRESCICALVISHLRLFEKGGIMSWNTGAGVGQTWLGAGARPPAPCVPVARHLDSLSQDLSSVKHG